MAKYDYGAYFGPIEPLADATRNADSRVWGFVPEQNFVGKAFMIWMSIDFSEFDVRWSRIGHTLD